MDDQNIAIGIDLGTTNSCVGVFRNGRVDIITDEQDCKITPSMVSFTDRDAVVGNEAKNKEIINAENTVYGVKRLIGRQYTDETIQDDIKHWPFTVYSDNGKPAIRVQHMGCEKTVHPEEISAMVLEKLKKIAEAHLGHPVKDAVITVPAYFDNNQRQATRAAGQIAGLNVLRLMNEPTAAAVAYGLDKKGGGQRNVLVYDLGGGTFDISVLSMEGGTFRVKSITGDTHLGGEDFDKRMVDHFAAEIKNKLNADIFEDKRALRRLCTACEAAKIQLATRNIAQIDLDSLIRGKDFRSSISVTKFDELNEDLFAGTIKTVERALQDSGLEKNRIDDIVPVGGSTRILKIQSLLKTFFQKQRLNKGINPDEAVACGAAIQAARLAGDPNRYVQNLLLYDVVPLSLGVNVKGERMSTIIKRNESIPIVKSRKYVTTKDNQTKMTFCVYEGERAMVKDNNFLGSMKLTGIHPEPRGYSTVDVVFEIDEDCILHAKAKDRDSENRTYLSIVNNSKKLSQVQLERLIQEAEANRLADRMETLRIESMNNLEYYINDIGHALKNADFLRSVKPQQKQDMLREVNQVSTWLQTTSGQTASKSEYESRRNNLEVMWNPISIKAIDHSKKITSVNKPVLYFGD